MNSHERIDIALKHLSRIKDTNFDVAYLISSAIEDLHQAQRTIMNVRGVKLPPRECHEDVVIYPVVGNG